MKIKPLILSVFIISIVSVSINVLNCKGENMKVDLSELKAVPQEKWDELSIKKIYFGHQSVGYNIIDGIKDIMTEMSNIDLNIVKSRDPNDFNQPIFAHSDIGQNKDPISKINDFKKIMDSGIGNKVEIAFFKFCYIDVVESTGVDNVFNYYVLIMDSLQKQYPKVKFVHVSVPLRTVDKSLKARLKRFFGKKVWGDQDAINRMYYNTKVVEKYGKNMLFDLAKFESIRLSGEENNDMLKGNKVSSLVPEYTYDGGHLNDCGKSIISKELLLFLVDLD